MEYGSGDVTPPLLPLRQKPEFLVGKHVVNDISQDHEVENTVVTPICDVTRGKITLH